MNLPRPSHIPEHDWEQARQVTQAQARVFSGRLKPPLDTEAVSAAAWVGMWQAGERWDPARSARFPTYAYRWVAGQMREEVRRQGHLTRRQQEEWRVAGEPAWGCIPVSLDELMDADESEPLYWREALVDERPGPETQALEALTVAEFWEQVAGLPGRDPQVLIRYGTQETQREISARLGISTGWVIYLERRALTRLRERLEAVR